MIFVGNLDFTNILFEVIRIWIKFEIISQEMFFNGHSIQNIYDDTIYAQTQNRIR